jgi:hypothetical protein
MGKERVTLGHVADRPALRRHPAKRHAFRRNQSGKRSKERSLAAAAQAEQNGESIDLK